MKPVDEIIQNDLLLLVIGESIAENEIQLYSFSARSRGLGIPIFSRKKAVNDFDNFVYVTVPLVALIVTQDEKLPKNKIVIEQIEAIKRNNLNQLSEKINRNESELLPDMKLQSRTKYLEQNGIIQEQKCVIKVCYVLLGVFNCY